MRWFPRNLFHLLFRLPNGADHNQRKKNTRKKREAKRKKWCSSLTSPWYLFYAISNWIIIRFYFLWRTTKKTRNQFGYENMFDRTGSDMMVRYSRATTKKIIKIVFADVKKKEKRSEANRIRNHSHWSTDSRRMCTQMEMEKRNFIWMKKIISIFHQWTHRKLS